MMLRTTPLALVLGLLLWCLLLAVETEASTLALSVGQVCAAGQVNATLNWQGGNPDVVQQWIDLSDSDNAWQDGTFSSAGPLPAATTSYIWRSLAPSSVFFVRVNQQLVDGSWDPSITFQFASESCSSLEAAAPVETAPTDAPACRNIPKDFASPLVKSPAADPATPSDLLPYLGAWDGPVFGTGGTTLIVQRISKSTAEVLSIQLTSGATRLSTYNVDESGNLRLAPSRNSFLTLLPGLQSLAQTSLLNASGPANVSAIITRYTRCIAPW